MSFQAHRSRPNASPSSRSSEKSLSEAILPIARHAPQDNTGAEDETIPDNRAETTVPVLGDIQLYL
jgi:hypothetical protein